VIEQLSVQQHFPISCSKDDINKGEALKQLLVRCYEALARIEQAPAASQPRGF